MAYYCVKTCYNILFHPLRAVPGPYLAKIFPQYMAPAMVGGRRAPVLDPSYPVVFQGLMLID